MGFVDARIEELVPEIFAQWSKTTAGKHRGTQYLNVFISGENIAHGLGSPPLKGSAWLVRLWGAQIRTLRTNVQNLWSILAKLFTDGFHQRDHIIALFHKRVRPSQTAYILPIGSLGVQGSHRWVYTTVVVVQNHQRIVAQTAQVVQRFKTLSTGHRTIANNRNTVALTTSCTVGHTHPRERRNTRRGMASAEEIIGTLLAL